MPLYDYLCPDGTVIEAFHVYGEHKTSINPDTGDVCLQCWLKSASVNVPLHHQSAISDSERYNVLMSKRASDKNDSLQVYEPGMDKDVKRNAAARAAKLDVLREKAVAKTLSKAPI